MEETTENGQDEASIELLTGGSEVSSQAVKTEVETTNDEKENKKLTKGKALPVLVRMEYPEEFKRMPLSYEEFKDTWCLVYEEIDLVSTSRSKFLEAVIVDLFSKNSERYFSESIY